MPDSIQEAFFTVCNEAKPVGRFYVSLYVNVPFYGGPEEGGWWGSDTELVAHQEFPSEELANEALARVEKLTKEMNENAKREYGEHCLRQIEWLETRDLESDFLPEVDGETTYFVQMEAELGSSARRGQRGYS